MKFIKDNYHDDKSDFQIEYTKDHFLWYFNCSESDFILLKFNGKVIGCVSGKADFIIIKNIPKKVYILNHLCIDKTALNETRIYNCYKTFLKDEIIVGFSAFYNANLVHKKTSKRIKRSYLLAHWNDKNFLSEKELLTSSFNMIEADIVSVVGTGLFSSKSVRISLKIDNCAEKYYSYFYKSSDTALDNKKMYLFIP